MHSGEQKVIFGGGTGPLHHRHRNRPSGPTTSAAFFRFAKPASGMIRGGSGAADAVPGAPGAAPYLAAGATMSGPVATARPSEEARTPLAGEAERFFFFFGAAEAVLGGLADRGLLSFRAFAFGLGSPSTVTASGRGVADIQRTRTQTACLSLS